MQLSIIFTAVLAATISPALAFWRLPCRGRLGVARLDPLVNPGAVSSHAHVIHGAGNFGKSVTVDELLASDCTSCAIKQDKSIYWTPAAYFRHPNGDTELVPQVGGMLVYYLQRGENVQAFPKGFRMLAGDPFQRNFTWPVPDPPKSSWSGPETSQFALSQKAIGFNCLNYQATPEPTLFRHTLPKKSEIDANCPDGLRMEMMFPSCWNGKDLDSPDHKSHMAYPNLVEDGVCPKGFETRVVSLLFETIWDTAKFKGVEGEFVLANGDPQGTPGQFFAPEEYGNATPISTSTYTEGNVVYELVIMEEKVTTTIELPAGATPPAGAKAVRKVHKRHGHGHLH
ncbi:WSC domain-containing protein [Histoplasma capsulatum G186AR]|uniref:WSC domain-containing protein n=3 Tax=Ajellomyces capsulatus TaxID=5037 RepID=C0NTC6_AJECG|nr:WSC domain-containing protein [Histoplasma capsulatum G186AR]EEH05287.1 WSC domain-containing protein [Histoplasma capsulatum G186AR]